MEKAAPSAGVYVIRTYTSGSVGEKTKYYLSAAAVRNKRKFKSELRKKIQNEENATRRVARLINANFDHQDYLVGLDYDNVSHARVVAAAQKMMEEERILRCAQNDEEKSLEDYIRIAAQKEMVNYLRRVKRELAKNGESVKYIGVTSDMDGKTGEAVRIHHHIVVSGNAIEAMKTKWGRGMVYVEPLKKQDDYLPLTRYLMDQVRNDPDQKSYTPSRNLAQPKIVERVVHSAAELRAPKGAEIKHRSEWNGKYSSQYIRYILPKNDDEEAT